MNLPNILTIIRLLLVPVFSYFYRIEAFITALIIFLAAAATDALDGYLARKYHQVTNFGKLADPLADKLMTLTMLYSLSKTAYVPHWVLIVMACKELIMILGSSFLVSRRNVIPYSTWPGKVTTFTMIVAIVLVYPWHQIVWLRDIGDRLITVAVGFALFALVSYVMQYFKYRVKKDSTVKED